MGRAGAAYLVIFWLFHVHMLFFRHAGPLSCPLETFLGTKVRRSFAQKPTNTTAKSVGLNEALRLFCYYLAGFLKSAI
jgi:hypothetical protein